jgi:hypothetical protein
VQVKFEGGPFNGRTVSVPDDAEEYAVEMVPPPGLRDPNARFMLFNKTPKLFYRPSKRDRRIWKPAKMSDFTPLSRGW